MSYPEFDYIVRKAKAVLINPQVATYLGIGITTTMLAYYTMFETGKSDSESKEEEPEKEEVEEEPEKEEVKEEPEEEEEPPMSGGKKKKTRYYKKKEKKNKSKRKRSK